MTDSEPSTLAAPADALVEVGTYASFAAGSERGLVVLALGVPYWLVEAPGGFSLRVEPAAVATVREQLRRFERECLHWPPPPIALPPPAARGVLADAVLWMLAMVWCFSAQGRWPAFVDAGVLDPAKVFRRGELWRPATSLLLHADARHLLANLLTGLLVVTATLSTFGRWRGWLLLLGASVAANFVIAALRLEETYRSLGASTAIFAGVGLLTGNAIRLAARTNHPLRWRAMFVSFGAGATALALHGAGGAHVDVPAHACGFIVGTIAGLLAGAPRAAVG